MEYIKNMLEEIKCDVKEIRKDVVDLKISTGKMDVKWKVFGGLVLAMAIFTLKGVL